MIVKHSALIIRVMAGVAPMLKTKRPVPKAKPRAEAISLRDVYQDTMRRFPKTMALLAE